MIIRDRFTLGTFSGLCGGIPQIVLLLLLDFLRLMNYGPFEIAGGVFLHRRLTETPGGLLIGVASWLISSAFMGILIAYLIKSTGADFWWVKGIVLQLTVMYIFVYGFLFNMGSARVIPFDRSTNISMLLGNVVFALITAYFIVRWGSTTTSRRKV